MKILRNVFDVNAFGYCGLYLDTETMKRVVKIANKATEEIRTILQERKKHLHPSFWTLAYTKDGKQITVNYSDTDSEYVSVEDRINLFRIGRGMVKRHKYIPICSKEQAKVYAIEKEGEK